MREKPRLLAPQPRYDPSVDEPSNSLARYERSVVEFGSAMQDVP